jgi:hypothetical protein
MNEKVGRKKSSNKAKLREAQPIFFYSAYFFI